jgi:hypothetical protein
MDAVIKLRVPWLYTRKDNSLIKGEVSKPPKCFS